MPAPNSRTVRVFLSSTFRDFAGERELLVKTIFPELRRRCRERQVELVDVDLRWGITGTARFREVAPKSVWRTASAPSFPGRRLSTPVKKGFTDPGPRSYLETCNCPLKSRGNSGPS
jgi:hypothetical protein